MERGVKELIGIASVILMAAGVVAFVIGELVLVHHGGSCSNGAVSVPRNPCTSTTYRAGGLIGGGIVVMSLASLVIAFTIGPTAMFVALGGAFLAGSISVLLSGTSPLLPLVIVWGVIGVAFLAIGLF